LEVEILFITRIPESAEVTKKIAIIVIAITQIALAIGKLSKNANSRISGSFTSLLSVPPNTFLSIQMAPFPKTVIQRKIKSEGTFTMKDWDDIIHELQQFWWPDDIEEE
jgi:hypothetical protein